MEPRALGYAGAKKLPHQATAAKHSAASTQQQAMTAVQDWSDED